MDKLFRLSEHVYILPFDPNTDRPNIGYIVSGDEAILFDAGCGPKTISLLTDELKKNNLPLPSKIIISHYHWDHSFATGHIEGELYGSAYTDQKMEVMRQMELTSFSDLIDNDELMPDFCIPHIPLEYESVEEIRLRAMDVVIDREMTLTVGDIHVDLLGVTSPHCEGQVVGFVREDKVLFLGDSDSDLIYGNSFLPDLKKRRIFNEQISRFSFDKVVLSHLEIMDREEFLTYEAAQL